jgi:formylglycine-generating enzyme required for sulfatase activity
VERRRIAFPEWEAWLARKRAEDGSAGPSPGEVRTVMLPGGVPLDLVWVPPGTFAMGLSEKERAPCRTPAGTIPGDDTDCDGLRPRTVTLPRGFWLARTELTQAQWSKIEYGEAGSSTPYYANRPRILSWKMAERTIKNLNRLDTGLSFRFPTEAEWEWAARGGPLGGGHAWSGSDDPADVAWTANSWPPDGGSPYSADFPEVATKRPNELGLFDMAGSYSEWCLDRHDPPDGASRTDYRVLRGGNLFLSAAYCRNGSHDAAPADAATGWTGLRVAADEAP